jgi:hypothetical protein
VSEVRIKRPQADINPTAAQGAVLPQFNHGDLDAQKQKFCVTFPRIIAFSPQFRITEDDILRITEDGRFRILEAM